MDKTIIARDWEISADDNMIKIVAEGRITIRIHPDDAERLFILILQTALDIRRELAAKAEDSIEHNRFQRA
jgi:TfoX/Sxy family transcriptional regulator of competence genes